MIDIIIPFHNQLKYTKMCLTSLINTTPMDCIHLILINSGSSDDSELYKFERWTECNFTDDYRFTYLSFEKNIGWCKSLNEGFKHLKGQYVLWCNNDILFSECWMQKMLAHFHDDEIGAVGPTSNYVMGRQKIEFNYGLWEEPTNFLIGFFLLFKREVIKKIGPVDERFGIGGSEEIDYGIRLRKLGYKMVIARDVFIHHFGSKTLWDYVGGTPELYDKFHVDKDKILREKWGHVTVDHIMGTDVPLTIGWGIPMRTNYLHRKFTVSCVFLRKLGYWHWIEAPKGLIHDSRNAIVEIALKYNCNYVFFTDDDHKIYPDTFIKLYNHMIQNPGVKIVGALAFKSRGAPLPCIFRKSSNKGYDSILDYQKGLIEVDGIGMACTLIDIEMFKKIPGPWFEIGELGEDLDFCNKAQKQGFKIYCDTTIIVPHLGDSPEIGEKDFLKWKEAPKVDFGMQDAETIF